MHCEWSKRRQSLFLPTGSLPVNPFGLSRFVSLWINLAASLPYRVSGAFPFSAPSITSWELCLSAALARCPAVSGNSSQKENSCAPRKRAAAHLPLSTCDPHSLDKDCRHATKWHGKKAVWQVTAIMPACSVLLLHLNHTNLNTTSDTTSKSTQWGMKWTTTQKTGKISIPSIS